MKSGRNKSSSCYCWICCPEFIRWHRWIVLILSRPNYSFRFSSLINAFILFSLRPLFYSFIFNPLPTLSKSSSSAWGVITPSFWLRLVNAYFSSFISSSIAIQFLRLLNLIFPLRSFYYLLLSATIVLPFDICI